MNAVASQPLQFTSAYRQLRPAEKAFVDGYVADVEAEANRRNERVSLALHRAIPADVIERSRGMLDKPMVRAAITERINEIAAATELAPQRVVKEWMSIGFASLADYFEIGSDGHPYFDLGRCTPEQMAAIQSVKIEESRNGRKIEFKLHDKLSALEKLARFMGVLEPDNPVWRGYQATPAAANDQRALPASVTTDQAADAYSQMING